MRKLSKIIITLVLVIIMASMSMAAKVLTPTEPPEGVKIITINEANKLLYKKDVYVFDMRKALHYSKGHIPGALSLPYKWTEKGYPVHSKGEFDMSRLPADKDAIIIFHSEGPDGWKSYYASKVAKEAGYKNIMWFRGGYSSWVEKGYTIEH